jgi:hypothetical protein
MSTCGKDRSEEGGEVLVKKPFLVDQQHNDIFPRLFKLIFTNNLVS